MRRKSAIFILSVFGLACIWGFWMIAFRSQANGIYLVDGGLDYVEISGSIWKPQFNEHEWHPDQNLEPRGSSPIPSYRTRLKFHGQSMTLFYQYDKETLASWGEKAPADGHRKLQRGDSGDWDLVEYRPPITRELTNEQDDGSSAPLLLPSYLHRIDDKRIVEYFTVQRQSEDTTKAISLAEELISDFPDDLFVRTLYLGALLRKRNSDDFAKRLAEWRADFVAAENPFLQRIPDLADYAIRAREAEAKGTDGFAEMHGIFTELPTLEELSRRVSEYPKYPDYYYPPDMLFRTQLPYGPDEIFLHFQIGAKSVRTLATLRLFEGRQAESLQMLSGIFHQSKLLNTRSEGLDTAIGTAFMAITVRGLEVYALNCIRNPGDESAFFELIGRSADPDVEMHLSSMDFFNSPLDTFAVSSGAKEQSFTLEVRTRSRTSFAMLEALRVAAAVRAQQARTGKLPTEIATLAPEFLEELPSDPFMKDRPISYRIRSPREAIAYSYGPDLTDDYAAFAYDPTNGVISTGDVLVRIPREPEFPFSSEGPRAAEAADLARQFPHGLPTDIFAATRGKPLSVWEDAQGVAIYSYGPDSDEHDADPPHELEEMYDPTNGIISAGDIFVRLQSE